MLWSVVPGKPVLLLDVIHLAQVWLYNFFQGLTRKSHVGAVSVHGTVLEISTIHKDVHKVVVELQHPELGVLVDKQPMCMGRSKWMVFLLISSSKVFSSS